MRRPRRFVRDLTPTRDEARGLMSNLPDSQPNAATRFTEWPRSNADQIGVAYALELARHFRE